MNEWWQNLKKIPLLLMILVTGMVFFAFALFGKETVYAEYEQDLLHKPYFSIVFEGLKDDRYPWEGTLYEKAKSEQEEQLESLLAQATEQEEQTETSIPEELVQHESVSEAEEETAPETEEEQEEEITSEEEPEEEETSIVEKIPEEEGLKEGEVRVDPENETHLTSLSMPEGVGDPVMGAADYGVAGPPYLSPAGTVFNTDTAGPFAENGEYYLYRAVNEEYFSDALIVGDSRTVGLRDFGGMRDCSTVLAKESLNVFNLFTKSLDYTTESGETAVTTLLDLLLTKQYRKVYLSVGINELGTPDTKAYYQKYREAIAVIRQLQPDAIIYMQGIMHVTRDLSSTDKVFNNTSIVQRNIAIETLANGHDIFYLDMNPEFCDENGDLKSDLSNDGIHLKASAYATWRDYLMTHAIYRDADDYTGFGPIEEGVKIPGVTVPAEEDKEG